MNYTDNRYCRESFINSFF